MEDLWRFVERIEFASSSPPSPVLASNTSADELAENSGARHYLDGTHNGVAVLGPVEASGTPTISFPIVCSPMSASFEAVADSLPALHSLTCI